jgi:hypothetical protein
MADFASQLESGENAVKLFKRFKRLSCLPGEAERADGRANE